MPDLTPISDWVNSAMAAAGAGAAVFFGMRRKYSQDSTAIAYDKTERDLVAKLMTALERSAAERDTAMKVAQQAWDRRTDDAVKIAELTAQLAAEKDKMKDMREDMLVMRLRTQKLMTIVIRLDPKAATALDLTEDDQQITPHTREPGASD